MNRADQKDHLIFCRNWTWDNVPYGMEFVGSDLRRSYRDEVCRRSIDDYPTQSAFISRLDAHDFLESKIEIRQLKTDCGSDRWRAKKDGSGKPDYARPLMGGVKVFYKVVAQDARPCFCQRNADRFRRLASWAKSLILRT